jgi:iron complex transport system substrate-binding protein
MTPAGKKKKWFLHWVRRIFCALSLCIIVLHCQKKPEPGIRPGQRIISLAPGITEILFQVGLGEQVVGVTSFCHFPPQAKAKTIVGGYTDQNLETILGLRPSLVIVPRELRTAEDQCRQLNLPVLEVNLDNIPGILQSIAAVGKGGGAEPEASALIQSLERRLEKIRTCRHDRSRPRVLLALGGSTGSGYNRQIFLAGPKTFLSELAVLGGGVNVYTETLFQYPVLSMEEVLYLDPEIILVLEGETGMRDSSQTEMADWRNLTRVRAVRQNRVFYITRDSGLGPGPRLMLLAEEMARLIHPEAQWN